MQATPCYRNGLLIHNLSAFFRKIWTECVARIFLNIHRERGDAHALMSILSAVAAVHAAAATARADVSDVPHLHTTALRRTPIF